MYANFLLGSLVVTEAAAARLGRAPLDLFARHAVNDHGTLTKDEFTSNMKSMRSMGRIISRFPVDPTDPQSGFVLVETDESWHETVAKLEGE
jgi:hypothetical protein